MLSIYNNIEQGICLHEVIYKDNEAVDYKIIDANRAYEKILGIPLQKAKQFLGSELYGDNKAPYLETCAQVAETGKSISIEEYFPSLDKYFKMTITSPEKGKFITLFEDITVKYMMGKKSKNEKERFKQTFEEAPFPIMLHTEDGEVLHINKVWEELSGYKYDEISTIADWTEKAYGKIDKSVQKDIDKLHNKNKKVDEGEYKIQSKDGKKRIWDFSSAPLGRTKDGRSLVMSMAMDITERRDTKDKLKKTMERLRLAMDAAEHGFWDWDLDKDEIYFSPQYYEMLGYEPGELPMEKETWVDLMHPEDRKRVVSRVEKYVEAAQNYEIEFRLKCKDGSWKWISGRGKSFEIDEEGISHRAIGVHVDIHDRKRRIKQLQEQKEELSAANQQLTAYSEEITAMNEELDESVKEVNKLNNRFVNMIELVSDLQGCSKDNDQCFFSKLLHSAIDIVPEVDHGVIYVREDDNKFKFVDAIGHNIDQLKKNTLDKEMFLHQDNKDIIIKDGYSLDINKISDNIKEAIKPVKKTIFINIMIDEILVGRIVLGIAEDSAKNFTETTKHLLKSFATLATAFFSFRRYNNLQGKFTKELITSIIQILEMYDRYTSGHSESVADIASSIAQKMGLSKNEIKDTYWAGMVHDIGKLLVPLRILNKNEALTDNEYELIKKHPYWGYKALSKSESLKHIAKYVLHHHERWDGSGYPDGIKGNKIPLISQILAVADAWDAMTSKRAYRDPLSKDKAIQEIIDNKGKQFSPKVVDIFTKRVLKL